MNVGSTVSTDHIRAAKAVVFDLDDTLFPERQYVRSGYVAVACDLRRRLGRTDPFESWLWARFLSGQAKGAFDVLNSEFGLGLSPGQVGELVKVYRGHAPRIRPFDGVPELLGRLHGEYRLGLLSDGYMPAQALKLEALKVRRFFDAIVFTEELGRDCWKPSTRGFEAIRDKLTVPHEALAYVADNPAKDFAGPNKLGWLTIQYLHTGQLYADVPACEGGRPRLVVKSPGELIAALRNPEDFRRLHIAM